MYAPVGLIAVGLVFGILTLTTVVRSPQFSMAASVTGGPVILLATAWLCVLAATAQLYWGDRRRHTPAILLALAGLAWLIPEWDNPYAPPFQYAVAILLSATAPALLLHAVLAWSDGRLPGRTSRNLVRAGYAVCLGLQGLAPALVLDPAGLDCTSCPANPWLVNADSGALDRWETLGGVAALVWLGCGVLALAAATFPDIGRARLPALRAPALVFLLVLIVWQVADLRGLHFRDPRAGQLWVLASLALLATAGGTLWQLAAGRRARRSVNRIVLALSRGQEPGLLRDAFAERLGDPTLQLLYPKADGVLVDATGSVVAPESDRGVTPVAFGGAPIAFLTHAPDLAVAAGVVNGLAAATYLGLEHEALTARALAEARDLHESGRRLIAAGDAERSGLERDLHDGAQQRLVGMALGLQVLAQRCPGPLVDEAREELSRTIAEVRVTAQGLSPPVLVDSGLVAALRSLAETRALTIGAETIDRVDPALETTAYQLVEQTTRNTVAAHVQITEQDGTLRMRLDVDGDSAELTAVANRVDTLEGSLRIARYDATTEIHLVLPTTADGLEPTMLYRTSESVGSGRHISDIGG
jgi:signal transduction histidine kinase